MFGAEGGQEETPCSVCKIEHPDSQPEKKTNTKKLIYKHKYTNTQLYNHKYANTNTQGQKGTECKKLFLKQTGKYGNFSQDRKTNYGLEKPSFVKKKIFCEITS